MANRKNQKNNLQNRLNSILIIDLQLITTSIHSDLKVQTEKKKGIFYCSFVG